MFLYEARARERARAPRTGTSSAQLGLHFGPLLVKLERSGSSKPKKTFQVTSAGWARPARAAGPKESKAADVDSDVDVAAVVVVVLLLLLLLLLVQSIDF